MGAILLRVVYIRMSVLEIESQPVISQYLSIQSCALSVTIWQILLNVKLCDPPHFDPILGELECAYGVENGTNLS